MFHSQKTILKEGAAVEYEIFKQDQQLSYEQFLSSLQSDQAFRSFFVDLLKEVPLRAYHWETPPVTGATVGQPFEFVVTKSPGIDLPPDPGPFQQYFGDSSSDNDVAVFNNLGNDARLIAPVPKDQAHNYSHIGVFTEEAPEAQQYDLWQTVGRVTQEILSDKPVWLNTAGGGVAWLHVRLDSRPKYYRHRPYADLEDAS